MPTLAYIGPGAGFAVIGSFAILFAALLLGLFTLASLPFRLLAGLFRRRPSGRFRRCVVVGFDGMDPRRAAALLDAGRLPNLARLRDSGTFAHLGSTCPPISPVAWSTFATGVNPGKHNIFDFLGRDLRTCLPELSSARIEHVRGRAGARLLRRSRPFWHLLGERGVAATVLRVPVTFPPERFRGLSLAAMCTPDVRGTQGEFTVFQSGPAGGSAVGGRRIRVTVERRCGGAWMAEEEGAVGVSEAAGAPSRGAKMERRVRAALPGPRLKGREIQLPLEVCWPVEALNAPAVRVRLGGQRLTLQAGVFSPWVRLTFRCGLTRVHAICRLLLVSLAPEFRLYVSPLNIDPERPAMPISWPAAYSIYLAKLHGPFATLGLAEDTWALTEGVIDEAAFLRQVADIHQEREAMFRNALQRTRRGLCVCVFDLTDRVQHTFLREDEGGTEEGANGVVEAAYEQCDRLVGDVLQQLGPDDLLLVVSDHGFTSFTRGVNVNAWLREQGYLAVKAGAGSEEYLRNVDWSATRAYSFGLAGIYLNLQGREAGGIVAPGETAQALKDEIAAKLSELCDPATGMPAVRRVYDAALTYSGPYVGNAPDLVVGWRSGYRHSWEAAVGRTDGVVFADNPSQWRGDHCVDRDEVPGVLFCNRRIALPARGAHLADLAPTILGLWGIPAPAYLDGAAWTVEGGRGGHPVEKAEAQGA
jgi:predicted AlkP superfamily phosphohydrolase/phosphomutase